MYVKCASIDAAGKSFRAMYGNWYDGKFYPNIQQPDHLAVGMHLQFWSWSIFFKGVYLVLVLQY